MSGALCARHAIDWIGANLNLARASWPSAGAQVGAPVPRLRPTATLVDDAFEFASARASSSAPLSRPRHQTETFRHRSMDPTSATANCIGPPHSARCRRPTGRRRPSITDSWDGARPPQSIIVSADTGHGRGRARQVAVECHWRRFRLRPFRRRPFVFRPDRRR